MVFNSLPYFIFLPAVFLLFMVTPDRWRWIVLLLCSFIFYGFLHKPALLVILTIVILSTYCFGRIINISQDRITRNRLVWAGILTNLSFLIYFKYLPFIVQNMNTLLKMFHSDITLQVPASQVSTALSFFIFSSISYLADIYFRMSKPEPHLGYLALHISFFPKLLQGPIERAKELLPQLKEPYQFDYAVIRSGLLLFTWGLFQKVVVADRLGVFVDVIYDNPRPFSGLTLIVSTYCYAFQLYYDFSGYTNMALGTASLFNIRLTQNFNRPYLATSIVEFWRRWHISFSRWIFEYIFEPLQMHWREWGIRGTAAALVVTFLIVGIWHGASWGYIVFGALQGLYIVTSLFWKPYQKKLHKRLGLQKTTLLRIWQTVFTFQIFCFALIFFRTRTISDALYIIKQSIAGLPVDFSRLMVGPGSVFQILSPLQSPSELLFALCLMIMLTIFSAIERSQNPNTSQLGGFGWLSKVPLPIRISIYAVLFYLFAFHGASTQNFIYLQF
jgi:D-alanyl-lipoteichoic acid acyltransferase DltB (MBOAT superfamily)